MKFLDSIINFFTWEDPADKSLRELAEEGDLEAMEALAEELVVKHDPETFTWAQKLVYEGSVSGIDVLGYCYATGIGTPVDIERAEDLYKRAAALGFGRAWGHLGNLVLKSGTKDTPPDYKQALSCFRQGEKLADPVSYYGLGILYRFGWAVVRSFAMVERYWNLAAKEEYLPAIEELAHFYIAAPEPYFNPQKAIYYYQRAADLGSTKSMISLAQLYACNKYGIKRQPKKAIALLQKAADLGDSEAYNTLGTFYAYKELLGPDPELAREYYLKAIEMGNENAQENLRVFEFPDKASVEFYENLKERLINGTAEDHYNFALCFLNGRLPSGQEFERDMDQCVEYMKAAYDMGYEPAALFLGHLYLDAVVTDAPDPDEAERYLRPLAEKGNAEAMFFMAGVYNRRGNKEEELLWLEGSAAIGTCPGALAYLAQKCLVGHGMAVDKKRAAELLLKAAKSNDEHAWFLLGIMKYNDEPYNTGDYSLEECLIKATNGDDADAAVMLACLYGRLIDTRRHAFDFNVQIAFELLSKLSKQGNAEAKYFLGRLMLAHPDEFRWGSPEGVKELALNHISEAARNGYREAIDYLTNLAFKNEATSDFTHNNQFYE